MSHVTVRLARLPAHLYSQQQTIITYSLGANLIKNRRVSGCLLTKAKNLASSTAHYCRAWKKCWRWAGWLELGQPFNCLQLHTENDGLHTLGG